MRYTFLKVVHRYLFTKNVCQNVLILGIVIVFCLKGVVGSLVIYVDIIWLLNWFFDCLLLYWTAILLKRNVPYWRLVFGGLIGSLIIILSFTSYVAWADHILIKLLFSIFMILMAFGFIRWSLFLKSLATLYFITFLSGGIILGLHYLFSFQVAEMTATTQAGMNKFGDPMSWLFVVIGFPLAWYYSKRTLDGMEMTKIKHEQLVNVFIKVGDFEATFKGFIDTGNQLYDPLSRAPVMIVSIRGYETQLPTDFLSLINNSEKLVEGDISDYTWAERIRMIPYKVVGNNHQLLVAIRPDRLEIKQGEKVYTSIKGIVAFTIQQLSSNHEYQCIVHPKMLTGIPLQVG